MKDKLKNILSKKLELDKNHIKNYHNEYYDVSFNNLCCNDKINNPNILFKNIKEYEYDKVIEKLANNYKNTGSNYYKKLYEKFKIKK